MRLFWVAIILISISFGGCISSQEAYQVTPILETNEEYNLSHDEIAIVNALIRNLIQKKEKLIEYGTKTFTIFLAIDGKNPPQRFLSEFHNKNFKLKPVKQGYWKGPVAYDPESDMSFLMYIKDINILGKSATLEQRDGSSGHRITLELKEGNWEIVKTKLIWFGCE